jgi:hypothetical protein
MLRKISEEVQRAFEKSDPEKYRAILIKMDGAMRYFGKWREVAEQKDAEINKLTAEKEIMLRNNSKLKQELSNLEDANYVLYNQFLEIEKSIQWLFPDVFEVEKTRLRQTPEGYTIDHGLNSDEMDQHVNQRGVKPITLCEMAIYLFQELHTIRATIGGNPNQKINRLEQNITDAPIIKEN